MDFAELETHFQIELYRWATADLVEQFDSQFPLVKLVKSQAVEAFGQTLNMLDPARQKVFVRCLTKRFHPKAASLLGEVITREEEELVRLYRHAEINSPHRNPAWSKQVLKLLLEKEARDAYGAAQIEWEGGEGLIRLSIGSLTVNTFLEVGSPIWRFCYDHRIYYRGIEIHHRISPLGWWGISSETDWQYGESPEAVAQAFALLSRHFLSALPTFFPKEVIQS